MKNKIPENIIQAMKESDKPINSKNNDALSETEEIRYKLMDLTHDRRITMSNQLVFSSQPMTTLEARLLRIILSQVDSYQTEKKEEYVYTARVVDLAEKLGCPSTKNIYSILETAGHSLRGRGFFLQNEDGDWIEISWFSYVKYTKRKGILEFKLNPDMNMFLTNLKNNFSYYSLDLLLSFKSKYSVRLYETIYSKVTRDTKTRTAYFNGYNVSVIFDIEEIRVVTATLHKYVGKTNAFKVRVIEPAIKEINENSEMFIIEYKTMARASNATDTFKFVLYQKEARNSGRISEKQKKLLCCDEVVNDQAILSLEYINNLFEAFSITTPINMDETSKLIEAYHSTKDFNQDFKKAFPKAKSDIVKYMIKMVENRNIDNSQKSIKSILNDNAKLSLSYVKNAYDAFGIEYSIDQLGEVYAEYIGNTKGFNDYFLRNNANNPMHTNVKEISEKSNDTNINKMFHEITEYWNNCCFRIKLDVPDDVEVYLPKEIRRTTKNQKEFFAELINNGETVESIKKAIDVAVYSQYFLRTHGSFGFFINPRNYYDIASGERDFDSQASNMWKMSKV